METFNSEVRENVLKAYNNYCGVEGCFKPAIEFHHAIHNTEQNQKKYPLFIESPFNCRPICRYHHNAYGQFVELNITDRLAQVYEDYLQKLKGVL